MNYAAIAARFLSYLANHPEIDDWEKALEFYLRVNNTPYDELDLRKLKNLIRAALRKNAGH